MPLLNFDNTDVLFTKKKLTRKIYTIKKALVISLQVKLINKNNFAKPELNKNFKGFIYYINSLAAKLIINTAKKGQIF